MSPRAVRPLLRPVLVGFALSACLAVAGCGGDSAPAADPPPFSPSASPSVSPSAAPTAAPPGETAREFIERWFALEKYSESTGDTRGYRAITKSCEPCRETADSIDEIYANGGFVRSSPSTVMVKGELASDPGTRAYRVEVDIQPSVVKMSASSQKSTLPGGLVTYRVVLREGRSWSVLGLVRLATS